MVLRLKEIRELRGFTQQQVADLLGCDQPVYSRYETGIRRPSYETLLDLSDIFQVSVDYILGRDIVEGGLSDYEKDLILASRKLPENMREEHLKLMELRAKIDNTNKK